MHCCTCSRVCHHIGGPYDCGNHNGLGSGTGTFPYPDNYRFPIWQELISKSDCEHCYCKPIFVDERPHLKCCNCGNQKVDPTKENGKTGTAL